MLLRSVSIETGYVTKSVLAMPLHGVDGKPMGALQALNKPGGNRPEDVDLLGLCGSYAASALETQRLRKEGAWPILREMEIAREVQQHLLPRPRSPGDYTPGIAGRRIP